MRSELPPSSPTQFAWQCCAAGDYPPPLPKRSTQARYGADADCCLCGGDTKGVGWPRKLGIAPTSTDIPYMQRPTSQTVCQACVATMQSAGWIQYAAAHPERGLKLAFEQKEGKAVRQWNWLYSHHLFIAPDRHECPDRARWREILANPPNAPFMAILTTTGKKQLIFKGRISYNPEIYFLQVDDDSVCIKREDFIAALADFNHLYLLGFSKDSILSGIYHNKTLLDVGIKKWKPAEDTAKIWRVKAPLLWAVCHYVAQRPDGWEPLKREVVPAVPPALESSTLVAPSHFNSYKQEELF